MKVQLTLTLAINIYIINSDSSDEDGNNDDNVSRNFNEYLWQ